MRLTTNSDIVFYNKTMIIYYSHRVFTAQKFDTGRNLKLNLKVNYVGTLEKVCVGLVAEKVNEVTHR